MEKETRPPPKQARLWVDMIQYIKENAPGGRLSFFTYAELCIWLVTFLFFRISRLKYAFFVLFGWGYWARQAPFDSEGLATGPAEFHLSISKILPSHRTKTPLVKQLGGPVPPQLNAKKHV